MYRLPVTLIGGGPIYARGSCFRETTMAAPQYAKERPFNSSGPLGRIPALIQNGQIPPEFWPLSDEDLAANAILQRNWELLPLPDPKLLLRIAYLNHVRTPMQSAPSWRFGTSR
jgi:hypothetical protein